MPEPFARAAPSMPSTLSALRLVALPAPLFTRIGARPLGTVTARPRAEPPVPFVFVICRTGPLTPLLSVVVCPTVLTEPSTKEAANAVPDDVAATTTAITTVTRLRRIKPARFLNIGQPPSTRARAHDRPDRAP